MVSTCDAFVHLLEISLDWFGSVPSLGTEYYPLNAIASDVIKWLGTGSRSGFRKNILRAHYACTVDILALSFSYLSVVSHTCKQFNKYVLRSCTF